MCKNMKLERIVSSNNLMLQIKLNIYMYSTSRNYNFTNTVLVIYSLLILSAGVCNTGQGPDHLAKTKKKKIMKNI